jgi:alkylresorcinol/alkylpyrone synthase
MIEASHAADAALRRNGERPPVAHPRIAGVAVANPGQTCDQAEMIELLGLAGDPFGEAVFASSGVTQRHLALDADLLPTSLQERTERTEALLLRLATDAVDQLDLDPHEVGVVITATFYSLGGPTLAHRVIDHYGLDPDTDKYHLTGVGCASAVPLLRLASQALRDRPGEKALVIGAEAVSGFLGPVDPSDDKVRKVGSALFGDGCAAAVLELDTGTGAPGGAAIVATAVHQVPDTLDLVRFSVTADDAHMEISRELPVVAETGVRPLVETFLDRHGIATDDIDHWLVHPGGPGIVEGLRKGLDLTHEQVAPSARVLSENGNVGTPSALLVLKATEEDRRPAPGDIGLMVTIGPGVTVGLMLLLW